MLSKREKNILMLGSMLVFLIGIVQFVFLPLKDKKAYLERVLVVETDSITQMRSLQRQYLNLGNVLHRQKEVLQNRSEGFTLFSFLDVQAQKSGLKKNIEYMKPYYQDSDDGGYTVSKVKLKLNNMYLAQCIRFLRRLESSPNGVHIISLTLNKSGKKNDKLDMIMEVKTLMLKEKK